MAQCNWDVLLYTGLVTVSIGLLFIFIGLGDQVGGVQLMTCAGHYYYDSKGTGLPCCS